MKSNKKENKNNNVVMQPKQNNKKQQIVMKPRLLEPLLMEVRVLEVPRSLHGALAVPAAQRPAAAQATCAGGGAQAR